MPEITLLNKNYRAEKEIVITEGKVFIDNYESDKITPCSFHPLEIIAGNMSWEKGRLFIR